MKAGVHGLPQAGIHGDSRPGGSAFAICISGGYGDNVDMGDKMYVALSPYRVICHGSPSLRIAFMSAQVCSTQ